MTEARMVPQYLEERPSSRMEEDYPGYFEQIDREFQERKAIRTAQLEDALRVQADLDSMASHYAVLFAAKAGLKPESPESDYKHVAIGAYRLSLAIAHEGAHQYDRLRSDFPDFEF